MENTVSSLLSSSSSPTVIEHIQDIMDDMVLAVMGTNDPLNVSTDIHHVVTSRGAELLLYEHSQVVYFFLRSNFTNNSLLHVVFSLLRFYHFSFVSLFILKYSFSIPN
jgi:hypothetical protein